MGRKKFQPLLVVKSPLARPGPPKSLKKKKMWARFPPPNFKFQKMAGPSPLERARVALHKDLAPNYGTLQHLVQKPPAGVPEEGMKPTPE